MFLQCEAITNLPWKDLGEAGPITIYIGRTLQREIDRLKGDGNQRRAKRAREANALFRKILHAPRETIILQQANPRVKLTFLPHLDPQRPKSPLLGLSNPDDCHIEEALGLQAACPGIRVAVLTHDTGLMLTARRVGLEPIEVLDAWLLQPEKDDRQKQIEELTRQLKSLQSQHARLSLNVRDDRGVTMEALVLAITEYDPPSPEQVESVLADLRNRYPRKEDFAKPSPEDQWSLYAFSGYPRKYIPPPEEKIERYHRDYESWLRRVETFLNSLSDILTERTALGSVAFRLENIGAKPAHSVQIEFIASPGFLLRPPTNEGKRENAELLDLRLPRRPEPPQGQYIDPVGSLGESIAQIRGMRLYDAAAMNIASMLPPKPLDPHAFYYRDGRSHEFVQSVSLTCTSFRHRLEPEDFEFEVQWQPELRSRGGAIRCRVFAENLPEPVGHVLPIRVAFDRGDITAEIDRLRPGSFKSFLTKPRPPAQSG